MIAPPTRIRHCRLCRKGTEHSSIPEGSVCLTCGLLTESLSLVRTTPQRSSPEAVSMPFGKYKGKTLGWIADRDVLYLDWLAGREIRSDRFRDAVLQIAADRSHEIEEAMDCREVRP